MQNANDEMKQEGERTSDSGAKKPSQSRFNEAEYRRWWEGLKAIRFPKVEQT